MFVPDYPLTPEKYNTKRGMGENQYGVKLGNLRKIARKTKTDHGLAIELWKTENFDAQMLSMLIIKPNELTADALDAMVRSVKYAQLAGMFDWTRFVFVAVRLVLAHATNNILNDLADYSRGVDKVNPFRTQYGTQHVEDGFMTKAQSRRMAFVTGLFGVLTGIYLVVTAQSPLLLYFLLAGIVFLFAYNWPLKHIGLGEPLVVIVWGPMMIGGGFLAITGYWSWEVAKASLPNALGPTAVLFGKHIDKIPWDMPRKVRTLPVLIGEHAARKTTMALLALQYLVVFYQIFTGFFAWTLALIRNHYFPGAGKHGVFMAGCQWRA